MFLKNKYINKVKLSLILIKQGCLLKCISTNGPNWSWDLSLPLQHLQKTARNGTRCTGAVLRNLVAALGPSAGVFPQEPPFSRACVTPDRLLFLHWTFFSPTFMNAWLVMLSVSKLFLCTCLLIMIGNSNYLSDNLPLCKGVTQKKKIFWTGDFYHLKRTLFLEVFFPEGVMLKWLRWMRNVSLCQLEQGTKKLMDHF